MFPLLLVLFIVVPIVEIFAIIQVGQAIGVLWTIALLIADSILGSLLMRSQGRAAWRRFNAAIAEGRAPAREVLDGVLVIFGGALLLTPGFVTDVFGVAFLLPPTRAVLRKVLVRRFAARMIVSAPPRRGGRPPRRSDADVEGTASEVDPRKLR
ncbi:MAG: FxsA family protein [Actinomycetota bacterium]|nr:FxsA family protein [Actinomycetota bacterium]